MTQKNALKKDLLNQEPHHVGHRHRLKRRFKESGAEALADYELLELVLTYALPRKDVKPIAKTLLKQYGHLANICAAPVDRLAEVDGLGESSALFLKAIEAFSVRMKSGSAQQKDVITNRSALLEYLHAKMAHLPREEFHVVYLNSKNHILEDGMLFAGTINKSAVYPREIMKKALDIGATGMVLAHNHPSGSPQPSSDDEALTMQVVQLGALMGLNVYDHIIIAKDGHFSFKGHGKM